MTVSDTTTPATTDLATADSASPAIALFGKMLTFSRLRLSTSDLSEIDKQLTAILGNKHTDIPIVIDSDIDQDLPELVDLLWSWGLQPIGVLKGVLEEQARAQQLAVFPADGKRIERIIPIKTPAVQTQDSTKSLSKTDPKPSTDNKGTTDKTNRSQTALSQTPHALASEAQLSSLIYDQVLRSGQSINHVGGDLILTNSVNSGAEAITDNNLHVYARAQGRLVAGATGDQEARIFCQVFNPSLVSVAGTYCLRDNLPEHLIDKPVQVSYAEGEGLVFTVMDKV